MTLRSGCPSSQRSLAKKAREESFMRLSCGDLVRCPGHGDGALGPDAALSTLDRFRSLRGGVAFPPTRKAATHLPGRAPCRRHVSESGTGVPEESSRVGLAWRSSLRERTRV